MPFSVKTHFVDVARYVYRRAGYPLIRQQLAVNRQFLQRYPGQRCFIMCTGPSLAKVDLQLLSGEKIFGCNLVFQHPDSAKLRFAAYFEVDSFRGPLRSELPYYRNGDYYRDLAAFVKQQGCPLFLNRSNVRALPRRGFHFENAYYLHCFSGMLAHPLTGDLAGKFNFMDGVVYTMIAVATYMGFKEIFLLGCDHSFSPMQRGHFYKRSDYDHIELVHAPIDQRYFLTGKFAEEHGVKIRNVVPEGFESPAYEKLPMEQLASYFGKGRSPIHHS